MHNASSLFAANPQSTDNRAVMVQASRELLVAVTRLLVVADVADIYKLLNATSRVSVVLCLSVHLFVCLNFANVCINLWQIIPPVYINLPKLLELVCCTIQ